MLCHVQYSSCLVGLDISSRDLLLYITLDLVELAQDYGGEGVTIISFPAAIPPEEVHYVLELGDELALHRRNCRHFQPIHKRLTITNAWVTKVVTWVRSGV